MAQEIEKKFLVSGDFRPFVSKSEHISQAYLCRDAHRSVRIRIKEDKAYITIKGASSDDGLSRYEWEKEIEREEALDLFALCHEGVVSKIRHYIPHHQLTIELDEFLEDNAGLLLAEVELPSTDTPFEPPHYLGEEVTGQAKYYNAYLSQHPFGQWHNRLRK